MRKRLLLLLAAVLALGACDGCAVPKAGDDVVQPDPPTAAEVLSELPPALDGLADSAAAVADITARHGQWRACIGAAYTSGALRSLGDAFELIDPETGHVPYCAIPGAFVAVDACGDLVDWTPLTEAEAAAEVDRYLGVGLPAARGVVSMVRGMLPEGSTWVAWLDAALRYIDGARGPMLAFLVDPGRGLVIPSVEVEGCRTVAPAPDAGPTDVSIEVWVAPEDPPSDVSLIIGPAPPAPVDVAVADYLNHPADPVHW